MLGLAARRAPRWLDAGFRTVTHLGGTRATVGLNLILMLPPATRRLSAAIGLANAASHLLVQLLKRTVVRRRPADAGAIAALADHPDAFSFPSGHACAAMAVALPIALAAGPLGAPALLLALLVGASRAYLRVHYVTDVLAGQFIGTVGGLLAAWWVGLV